MRKSAIRSAAQHNQPDPGQRAKENGKVVIGLLALSDDDCAAMLDSVIASQALEGVHISRDVAARLLDEALHDPLPEIG